MAINYYETSREEILARQEAHREATKEKKRAGQKARRKATKEKKRAGDRADKKNSIYVGTGNFMGVGYAKWASRDRYHLTRKEEEKLCLTPPRGTQFEDGTVLRNWLGSFSSTYRGNNPYAVKIKDRWYVPVLLDDLNNRISVSMISIKKRAAKKQLPFNLTKKYLRSIIPKDKKCPVFKVPFNFKRTEKRGPKDNSMSLDRIEPELGYVTGNVRWISQKANTIMSNATAKEVCMVGLFMHTNDTKARKAT